jgi:hypothetical protein
VRNKPSRILFDHPVLSFPQIAFKVICVKSARATGGGEIFAPPFRVMSELKRFEIGLSAHARRGWELLNGQQGEDGSGQGKRKRREGGRRS